MTTATFLGTGNFLRPGRYWNSFVLDGNVLVEPSPTALPHLRRCGLTAADLDVVVISHFHPDHTFGWPFLLLEVVRTRPQGSRFSVVGPPGVEAFLADMMALGAVTDIVAAAHRLLDLRYVEVDGSWQEAGPLRFRAIEVEHVPHPALLRVRPGDARPPDRLLRRRPPLRRARRPGRFVRRAGPGVQRSPSPPGHPHGRRFGRAAAPEVPGRTVSCSPISARTSTPARFPT